MTLPRALHGPKARKDLIDALKRIAEEKLAEYRHLPHFCQSWQSILVEVAPLAQFAGIAAEAKPTTNEEIISALFEPQAIELIRSKCKSAYWFWYLLSKLETNTIRINVSAIARAHARAKDSMRENRYGFNFVEASPLPWQLKGYPPGFVLEMWHKGRILCVTNGSAEFTVILNPLLVDD
jgi:hypothetical protein